MNSVVIGNGYMGSAFKDAGMDCITKEDFTYNGRNFNELIPLIEDYDVVINAIAKTDTRWSEEPKNFKELWFINAHFVKELSDYCNPPKRKRKKKFVHISTGDLYGNNFDLKQTVEDTTKIDVGTNYRLSKYGGEKFCHEDDLILRPRLPFDGRNHPKNLLVKIPKFTKLFSYLNDYTYIPDLVEATQILVNKNQKGIFNIASHDDGSVIYILRNILQLPQFQSYDLHDHDNPNIIRELNNLHVHNIMNDDKLRRIYIQTPLEDAVKKSWVDLQLSLQKA
jgi:nucleoside-diphosphate-sugar epimerase